MFFCVVACFLFWVFLLYSTIDIFAFFSVQYLVSLANIILSCDCLLLRNNLSFYSSSRNNSIKKEKLSASWRESEEGPVFKAPAIYVIYGFKILPETPCASLEWPLVTFLCCSWVLKLFQACKVSGLHRTWTS